MYTFDSIPLLHLMYLFLPYLLYTSYMYTFFCQNEKRSSQVFSHECSNCKMKWLLVPYAFCLLVRVCVVVFCAFRVCSQFLQYLSWFIFGLILMGLEMVLLFACMLGMRRICVKLGADKRDTRRTLDKVLKMIWVAPRWVSWVHESERYADWLIHGYIDGCMDWLAGEWMGRWVDWLVDWSSGSLFFCFQDCLRWTYNRFAANSASRNHELDVLGFLFSRSSSDNYYQYYYYCYYSYYNYSIFGFLHFMWLFWSMWLWWL